MYRHWVIFSVFVSLFSPGIWAHDLIVYYDLRPPLVTIEQGMLSGNIGRPAQQALDLAHIQYELAMVPIARQDLEVQSNQTPACSVGRVKTPERERFGQFSAEIARSPHYVAIVLQSARLPLSRNLQKWADERTLVWGVQHGLYYSNYIHSLIEQSGARILRFHQTNQHFISLIMVGRIDFFLAQEDEAREILAQYPDKVRIVQLDDLQKGEKRYFYCAKKVPRFIMEKLNQALKETAFETKKK